MLKTRPASKEDIGFLTTVNILANEERLCTRDDWDADTFALQTEQSARNEVEGKVRDSVTHVIEYEGRPTGRLRLIRPGDAIHVAGIQILPAHQGKGIDTRVMRQLIDEAQEEGLPLTLEVERDNPHAKRLYERLGFEVVEDRGDRELMQLRTTERSP